MIAVVTAIAFAFVALGFIGLLFEAIVWLLSKR